MSIVKLQELRQILTDWRNNQVYPNSVSFREMPSPVATGETYFHLTYKIKVSFPGISEDVVMVKNYHTVGLSPSSENYNSDLDIQMLTRLLPKYDTEFLALVEEKINEMVKEINPDGFF